MAREFATTNIAIWSDDDWRDLPFPAQHVYEMLQQHASLNYCGVADWRPGRLAPLARGLSIELIETMADCLEARHFIVRDLDTEEVLLRSWVRFDGLMRKPRMAIAFVKAFPAVSSKAIRGVVVSEALKLRDREPDLECWKDQRVKDLLSNTAIDVRDLPSVSDPFAGGFETDLPSVCEAFAANPKSSLRSATPSPSPSPISNSEESGAANASPTTRRACRLPDGWNPDRDLIDAMHDECPGVDLQAEHRKFTDYWRAKSGKDATKLDWAATWRNWIRNARPTTTRPATGAGGIDWAASMARAEERDRAQAALEAS